MQGCKDGRMNGLGGGGVGGWMGGMNEVNGCKDARIEE